MAASTKANERRGWYRRFVEHLDPGERMGELLNRPGYPGDSFS
jgi:hypothetical protein